MYETVNLPSGLISCDLLNTEFLLQFLRQRIFVYHHTDCFSTYIAFRHIQITSGFVAFRSPGILGDIIFSTIPLTKLAHPPPFVGKLTLQN